MSRIPTNRSIAPPSKSVVRERRTSANSTTNNTPSNNPFRLADRVTTSGKSGIVAYVGRTQFADGEWIGLILDEPHGKNDGSCNGVRYFETEMNRGLFCRPDKVQHLPSNGVSHEVSYNPSRLSIMEFEVNTPSRGARANQLDPSSIKNLELGDRVVIRGTKYGTLRYIGKIHINEGIWCGIKLDGPLGKHNGKIEGVRYFRCSHRFGIFAPLRHVEKVIVDPRTPHDAQNRLRDSSPDSNASECSSSQASQNNFQPRSPTHSKMPNSLKNFSAQEQTSTNEIAILMEKIREKDRYIEQLQQENRRDRLELSRTIEKMNELEINILALQQQNNMKDNENEYLIKQQVTFNQRLEDLQFQLEEFQYPDCDQNQHLVSTDELTAHERTKAQVAELQTINADLLHQNQIVQEELRRHQELLEKQKLTDKFIDELKKQIEVLKGQLADLQIKEQHTTSQWITNEASYKQQIKEYQLRIDHICKESQNIQLRLASLEQEKQTSDKRVKDLLDELKHHKENVVPGLEKQCQTLQLELQNRESAANTTMSEREKHYEHQIKQYRQAINQMTEENNQVRDELRHIQEENALKDEKTEAFISELKQNYERVQHELIELNDREQQASLMLNQRESFFEQQIKEYENNLNQATRQTESIQNEFAKLEEDKAVHEQKSNSVIFSLKQDYENQFDQLKLELIQLQEKDRTQNIIINERIAHYEIEIKEYQIKADQDTRELEQLRNQLFNVQEDKVQQDKQFNETIEALKQELQRLQNESKTQEGKINQTFEDKELKYQQEIDEHKINLRQADERIENLQTELTSLQQNKIAGEQKLNDTIERLRQDYENLKADLRNQNETGTLVLNEREVQYQSQMNDYEHQADQLRDQIQELQMKLTELNEEKTTGETQLNETIDALKQEYETQRKELQMELDELNEREQKAHKEVHQREAQITEYQDKLEEVRMKFESLQNEYKQLQREKVEFNETIDKLQRNLASARSELESQDHTQNMALNEREIHYQAQIKTYQAEQEQSLLQIQSLQTELSKLQQEKVVTENELNKSIDVIKQDVEKLRNELEERERQKETALKQREAEYKEKIEEHQKNLELSTADHRNVQWELENLRQEKSVNEKNLNEMMFSLQQDYEKQIDFLQTQVTDLQKQRETSNDTLTQKDQDLHDYQTKFNELNEQMLELKQQNETKTSQIEQLQVELKEREQVTTVAQTQNEFVQQAETLAALNEKLNKEITDLKHENEILSKSAEKNDQSNEKQDTADQLTKQVDDLQKMHFDLLEKQANREQTFEEEKKCLNEKVAEYQMTIALMKSEFMVEMENAKLDHDQEILRLKTQLQQVTAASKPKGKK
ncbi:unnamed protein product [Adineta ricciae]|uniref:CAP-Gly domain-containing protein n=1 Tax=Adineta ricciae TaxID=249248 RepID=A0A813XW49_ADIRI|nr:unnamed protein product [Adineta ricciae]CAF1101071.1 unnamed protein product [Adineta ricciae]